MDLERIKQNFRLRSGRSRKTKKHHKPNGVPIAPSNPLQTSAAPPLNERPSEHRPRTPDKQTEQSITRASPSSGNNPSTLEDSPGDSRQGTDPSHETAPSSVNEQPPQTSPRSKKEESANKIETKLEPAHSPTGPAATSPDPQQYRSPSIHSAGSSLDLRQADDPSTMPEANSTTTDADDFDLSPPKRRAKPPSTETLSELLFSPGHLDTLLQSTPQLTRFSAFLQRYSPHHYPLLTQYLETRKAIKAIEYANALADGLKPRETGGEHSTDTRSMAAKLDPEFEAICNASFEALMNDALPNYISYSLVKVASEIMTNEITGRSTPIMRDLVDGLSEVFCLTDPNQDDNPIIYASEEFYRFTRYGPDDVLNNNCRFLQGRKTNPMSPKRLKHAITSGEEISETLLNYKRDGRPFINLLMIAPLHDRNGKLKYHIGAQIDVTGLVEGGRVLDGFQRYLTRRTDDRRRAEIEKAEKHLDDDQKRKRRALARLRDLSETFDLEEAAVVQAGSRSSSRTRDEDDAGSVASIDRQKGQRRVYLDSDPSDDEDFDGQLGKKEEAEWTLGASGDGKLSGKLPGVYDSFILFRPAPSFRIVFMSPKLQKLGSAVQSPFLSHVAAPSGTLNGLSESLRSGVPVSAKIHFTEKRGERREGTKLKSGTKHDDGKHGRAIWISCTPLLGEDDAIGVWMCVVVEKTKVGSIKRKANLQSVGVAPGTSTHSAARADHATKPDASETPQDRQAMIGSEESSLRREDIPIKPVRIDSQTVMKAEAEPSFGTANAGQDQTSNTVRPQPSIYFDAEQGNKTETTDIINVPEENPDCPAEHKIHNDDSDLTLLAVQERDPRAVVTPVPEYDGEEKEPASYVFETEHSSPSSVYHDETNDEFVATRSPVTPTRQPKHRLLIEEDSDVLEDSDLDHQRDNMRIGRSRVRSASLSSGSLNSPASDIPPSIPSSAMMPDDGEDHENGQIDDQSNDIGAGKEELTPEVENSKSEHAGDDHVEEDIPNENVVTPTATRQDRPPSPPEKDDTGETNEALEESIATIIPVKDQSPARNSNHDSAISLNSPAQPVKQSSTKSGSRSHSPGPEPNPMTPGDNEDPGSRTPKNLNTRDEESTNERERERDIETWVTEGRPPTSRHASDNKGKDQNAGQDYISHHKHNVSHSNTVTRNVPGGLRLDFLGTGENRWAARQPRRRLDGDSEDYGDDGESDEGDDALTRSDHCATSPYSVD